jgi:hypothetical protein
VPFPERPKPKKEAHVKSIDNSDTNIASDRGLHKPAMQELNCRHGCSSRKAPYRAKLRQDGVKYENCPAGVAHPKVLEFEVAILKDLLLQSVSPGPIFGKLDLCIVSVSVPCDEGADGQSNYDHDQQHDSKESERQMLPSPAPVA